MTATVETAVTLLFVPGDRPERFEKAAATSASLVIIDLEDAVAEENKAQALENLLAALGAATSVSLRAVVRTNAIGSRQIQNELELLGNLVRLRPDSLRGLMIPKTQSAAELDWVAGLLPAGLALVPLIETAVGLLNIAEIASHPRVSRLAYGAIDFSLDVGASLDSPILDFARTQIVLHSKANDLAAPIDAPSVQIENLEIVANEAAKARNSGFTGKLCIHPKQIPIVAQAFRPTQAEVDWANEVLLAGSGASKVNGRMIDKPVINQALRIIESAKVQP